MSPSNCYLLGAGQRVAGDQRNRLDAMCGGDESLRVDMAAIFWADFLAGNVDVTERERLLEASSKSINTC